MPDGSFYDRDDFGTIARGDGAVGHAPAQGFAQQRANRRPIAAHRFQGLRIVDESEVVEVGAKSGQIGFHRPRPCNIDATSGTKFAATDNVGPF